MGRNTLSLHKRKEKIYTINSPFIIILGPLLLLASCHSNAPKLEKVQEFEKVQIEDTVVKNTVLLQDSSKTWTQINPTVNIIVDLKYATTDNFTNQVIYNCGKCYLRPHVAKALQSAANQFLQVHNLSIILYDCYRPRPAQQKLWDIVPDPTFVSDPAKGSMHNRGMAIDIGLVDSKGNVLDMGSEFDHFGPESYFNAKGISDLSVNNRKILRQTLEEYGFEGINSEWWHYSYRKNVAALSDWQWSCD